MPSPDPLVTKQIQAQHVEFARLFNGGKIDRLVESYYTADARLLPPNMPIVKGNAAIRAAFGELAEVFSDLSTKTGPVLVHGDLAVVTGTYKAKISTPSGDIVDDVGKFFEAWTKQGDGTWRCLIDSFTSDLPPQE